MNRYAFGAVTAAVLLSTCVAYAKGPPNSTRQGSKEQVWAKEPDNFLGISFKRPIPASLPSCPKDRIGQPDFPNMRTEDGICIDGNRVTYGRLWNTPPLGFPYTVDVMMEAGSPTTFILESRPDFWVQMRTALISRYGEPTSRKVSDVQNNAGATFDNETLVWTGKSVAISAYKRSDRVDKTQVFVSDLDAGRALVDKLKKEAAEGAAKL